MKLRERQSKGVFNVPWHAALRPLARALAGAKQLQVVERGFVNHENVRSRLERLARGVDCNEHQLRQIIILELWLRKRASEEFDTQLLLAA